MTNFASSATSSSCMTMTAISHKPPRSPSSPGSSSKISAAGLHSSSPLFYHSISPSTSSTIVGEGSSQSSSSTTVTAIGVDCGSRVTGGPSSSSTSPSKQHQSKKAFSVDSCKKKLSPSKRIDTFDSSSSKDRTTAAGGSKESPVSSGKTSSLKNRRRRRRSLSLCESFSDGESTDGMFLHSLYRFLFLLHLHRTIFFMKEGAKYAKHTTRVSFSLKYSS